MSESGQNPKHPDSIYIGGVFWFIEAYFYMRHRTQIINFIRLNFLNDSNHISGI